MIHFSQVAPVLLRNKKIRQSLAELIIHRLSFATTADIAPSLSLSLPPRMKTLVKKYKLSDGRSPEFASTELSSSEIESLIEQYLLKLAR